jgi:adenosine deaminase/adenosine deaminase CECR1
MPRLSLLATLSGLILASQLLAVRRYKQTYPDLKQLARQSLEYSFLPGQSLWESARYQRPQAGCRADRPGAATLSAGCASFLKANPRAREQWKLETQFASFEALPSFQASGSRPGGE